MGRRCSQLGNQIDCSNKIYASVFIIVFDAFPLYELPVLVFLLLASDLVVVKVVIHESADDLQGWNMYIEGAVQNTVVGIHTSFVYFGYHEDVGRQNETAQALTCKPFDRLVVFVEVGREVDKVVRLFLIKIIKSRKDQTRKEVELKLSKLNVCWALAPSLGEEAQVSIQGGYCDIFTLVQLSNVSFGQTVSRILDQDFTVIFTCITTCLDRST